MKGGQEIGGRGLTRGAIARLVHWLHALPRSPRLPAVNTALEADPPFMERGLQDLTGTCVLWMPGVLSLFKGWGCWAGGMVTSNAHTAHFGKGHLNGNAAFSRFVPPTASGSLPRVWVKPVDPEDYPDFHGRTARPVTRQHLDNQFHTTALRCFEYDRPPGRPPHRYRLKNIPEVLDLYTKEYGFGRVVWPMWPFLFADNWKEAIDEIAERGLYLFDIWAYCPSGPFERHEWSEYRVPDEKHRYILEKLGPRFLGYDNGEQDGRYIGGYAKRVCPAPATRVQAHEHFCQYFRQLGNDLQNYLVALSSLTFPHYLAQMGNHRLLGAETAQALPSVPMWYAFIRGAGKQYGILWFGNASVWNRWGWKSMDDLNAEDRLVGNSLCGPTAGTSMSLLRRLWYVEVMYGSVMMSFEAGHLSGVEARRPDGRASQKVFALTEIGREQLRGTRWCADHPDRGELHTPVALMLDYYTGWAPPRHLYTSDTYLVWGNMPYEKGDHQVDLLLRELYPGYEDAGFYHNERGFLTPTPCGDSFDVLLSTASLDVLRRYECVVILGKTCLEGQLLGKLRQYVGEGGHLVACANQAGPDAQDLFGVEIGNEDTACHSIIPGRRWPINEAGYRFNHLETTGGVQVLSHTRQGAPLAVTRQHPNGGSTLLYASEFFLSHPAIGPVNIPNETDQPLLSPYQMLEHARTTLLSYLRSFSLVDVDGPPIQYLVNVTARTDRLVVTLCNNTPIPWRGRVGPKRTGVEKAINWMTDREMACRDGVKVEIAPLDVVVLELLLDGPAFEVRQ